jgi:transketolase
VRNDICYHKANVKIVAVGGGLAYGSLGPTHHAVEDLAILRSLPEMAVLAPGDPLEAASATKAIAMQPGPCYLRLGRGGEPIVHRRAVDFQVGKAIQVRGGIDLTLVSTGGLLQTAVQTADLLRERGLSARVLSMHTVKPLDRDAVLAAAQQTQAIFTLEEHSVIGGLGSAVAEVLAESHEGAVLFRRFGLPSAFCCTVGTQDYLRVQLGLAPDSIATAVSSALEKPRAVSVAAGA